MKLFPISFAVSPKNSHRVGQPPNRSAQGSISGAFLRGAQGMVSTALVTPSLGWGCDGVGQLCQMPPTPCLSQGSEWKSFVLGVPPRAVKLLEGLCPSAALHKLLWSLACLQALWAAAGWIQGTLSSQLSPCPWSLCRINTGQAPQHS